MEEIEYKIVGHQAMRLYFKIQKEIPSLHGLSFHASTYDSGETGLYGFIHYGKQCEPFDSIEDLISLVSKEGDVVSRNEILFRKFN